MYEVKTTMGPEVLLTRETEREAYEVALRLAQDHIGTVFLIYKGKERISEFMCTDKGQPKLWTDRAIRILNGGPLKGAIAKTILDTLDPSSAQWDEIH